MNEQMVIGVDIDGINLRVGRIKGNETQKIEVFRLSSDESREHILEENFTNPLDRSLIGKGKKLN